MERQEQVAWNVLTDRWLEVERPDGRPEVLSPRDALQQAADIQTIRADSPLDIFAAYRFLLTLLYWKADECGGIKALREELLGGTVPQVVREGISSEGDRFSLFDSEKPFLQDPAVCGEKLRNYKSSGSFFMEFSCGTNIAHFHHGDDASTRLCLRCLTAGMMRVIPWTQSGGRGLRPSVHGAPPIRLLAIGDTLAETLGLNLVGFDSSIPKGTPTWSGAFKPGNFGKVSVEWSPIAYMEALTWNSRLIWIPAAEKGWNCWRCGADPESFTVGRLVYQGNENTKKPDNKFNFPWRDPSAFYPEIPFNATKKEQALEYVSAKSTREKSAFVERDIASVLFPQEGPCPVAAVQLENPDHSRWELFVPCVNASDNKSFDVRMIQVNELSRTSLEQNRLKMPQKIRESCDGWRIPFNPPARSRAFVEATRRLTDTDWACLASADRSMDKSPEAFDLFSGLYWSLRKKKRTVPSRQVAWLMLKLMASVPARLRTSDSDDKWNPLDELKTRQPLPAGNHKKGVLREYPMKLPDTRRLEVQLREILRKNTHSRHPKTINWPLLADQLNDLLGR